MLQKIISGIEFKPDRSLKVLLTMSMGYYILSSRHFDNAVRLHPPFPEEFCKELALQQWPGLEISMLKIDGSIVLNWRWSHAHTTPTL
jgi:hypothetical protein